MASVRQFLNQLNKPFLLVKWKVKVGRQLFLSTTILTYTYKNENGDVSDKELKLKSTTRGVVQELLVKEGEVVEPGAPLLTLQYCTHDLIIKEICADCGVDLWRAGMYQSLPETDLEVTHRQAEKIEIAGERELLRERKLALVICMDEILTDSSAAGQKSQLDIIQHKARPGAEQFLSKVSQCYDLHLLTSGSLKYASKVLETIDPNCHSVSKIWSCENSTKGTKECVETIFRHGDSMVCVIDHQEQEPDSAANMIHLTHFFRGSESVNNVRDCQGLAGISPVKSDTVIAKTEINHNLKSLKEVNNLNSSTAKCDDHKTSCTCEDNSNDSIPNTNMSVQTLCSSKYNSDLFCLERILLNIHNAYYKLCDQMIEQKMYIINQKAIPDLKNVIPYVRRNVLKGVNIVFSGLAPNGVDMEKMPLYILAKSLGANVTDNVILHDETNGTTHIVARKLGTAKTNQAKKFKHLFVISPEWLIYCEKCWEKVDESRFLLKKEKVDNWKSHQCQTTLPKLTSPSYERSYEEIKNELRSKDTDFKCISDSCSLTAALNMSSQDLIDMNNEVEEECTTDESDDEVKESSSKRKSDVCNNELTCRFPVSKKRKTTVNTSERTSEFSSVWVANGQLKSMQVPVWERAWEADIFDASESGSEYDYIYSEDEDCLL